MSDNDLFEEIVRKERTQTETREVVADLDYQWFEEHPQHAQRIRKFIDGEFDSDSGGFCGTPEDIVVLVQRGGVKVLFPLGSFDERGWQAGGLG